MRPYLLLLLAALLSLPACAQKVTKQKATTQKVKVKKPNKKVAATPAKVEAGPVLTFERTPCFGTCPAYSMQVFADGRIAYNGTRAVPVMGEKELRLPVATVNEMLRMGQEARFEQFQERYSKGTSDLPSTVVAIRQPSGKLKTVMVEEGAPEMLVLYVNYLGNQFDALAGINVASDR